MPPAMFYVPPTDVKGRQELDGVFKNELDVRRRAFEESSEYYEGDQPPSFPIKPGQYDDNVVVNVTKQAVDRIIAFLFPSMPRFQLDGTMDTESEAEKYLKDTWVENGGAFLLNKIASNGSLSGHNFVRILPPETAGGFSRIVNLNPRLIVAYWKADDVDKVLWYEMNWTVGKKEYIVDFVDLGGRWEIYEYSRPVGNMWVLDKTTPWNYRYGPIVDWQHNPRPNEFYGGAETSKDMKKLNRSINKVASDINRILRFHAFPKTIGIGMSAEDIKGTSIDSFWAVANPDAQVYNLEMKSDLGSSMAMLTFLNDAFLSQARVVIMKGTVKDFQRVTNTGIRAVFLDMIAKNQMNRWAYGQGLQEISRRILMLNNMPFDRRPDILWDDPLPTDDTEAINTLAIEHDHKFVSTETASLKRGYSWKEQLAQIETEAKDDALHPKPPVMGGAADGGIKKTAPIKQDTPPGA